jgi:hypothetical protein
MKVKGDETMNERWSLLKRYTVVGWKQTTWRWLAFWTGALAGLAFWTPGPFWLVFPSLTPVLFLYLLAVGFVLEILDSDWDDWHHW